MWAVFAHLLIDPKGHSIGYANMIARNERLTTIHWRGCLFVARSMAAAVKIFVSQHDCFSRY